MFQNGFYVSLRKTNIVGVDELAHQLPPDLGPFREFKVADWFCPDEWSKDGIFVPVREGDPMWFDLRLNPECACLCAVQRVNPVTGEPANLDAGLAKDPSQNYLALPKQRWLDGYAKDGKVYQFIVTKEGVGLAVSEFVLPKHMQDSHAIGFAFYAPKVERSRLAPVPRRSGWEFTPEGPRKSGTSPMWFSPTHTPASWETASHRLLRSMRTDSVEPTGEVKCSSIPSSFSYEAPSCGGCASAGAYDLLGDDGVDRLDGDADFLGADEIAEVDTVDMLERSQQETHDKAAMGAGGRIGQRIEPDDNTTEYYQDKPVAVLTVYLALPGQFAAIMKKGKRQDANRPDKYKFSGNVGGVQVPLIKQDA